MFRPRLRGRCLWLALFIAPGFCWVLIVLLSPLGWARNLLIARLEAATGRSVAIASVRLGWGGNLQIANLSFAEPKTPADPWLRIASARIDVHLGQVLVGCCQPGDVEVDGVALRIWRRGDGRFEFGDLGQTAAAVPLAPGSSAPLKDLGPALNIRVRNAAVHLVDTPNDLRLDLTGVNAQGSYKALAVQIDDLRGHLNGGALTLAGRLIRDPRTPRFTAEVQVRRVHLDHGLSLIETFVPLVARSDDALSGFVTARLAVQGQGASRAEVRRTMTGHGTVLLDPIDLDGSRILSELQAVGDCPKENHVGSVSTNFTIEHERVNTEDLTIKASKLPFVMAGWTDFDGRFDYVTRVDRMIASLPREARSWLGELKVNLDELTGLRIAGVPGRVHLTLNGRPLSSDPKQSSGERIRFRETTRKIRDRFFR